MWKQVDISIDFPSRKNARFSTPFTGCHQLNSFRHTHTRALPIVVSCNNSKNWAPNWVTQRLYAHSLNRSRVSEHTGNNSWRQSRIFWHMFVYLGGPPVSLTMQKNPTPGREIGEKLVTNCHKKGPGLIRKTRVISRFFFCCFGTESRLGSKGKVFNFSIFSTFPGPERMCEETMAFWHRFIGMKRGGRRADWWRRNKLGWFLECVRTEGSLLLDDAGMWKCGKNCINGTLLFL